MPKRGPKPSVYPEEILYCLIVNDLKILEDHGDGYIKVKGRDVWGQMSEALGDRIKSVNLYMFITQNRHRVFEDYLERTGYILDEDDKNDLPTDIDTEEQLLFQIEISGEQWTLIKPSKIYPNTLRSYYKAIINKILWDHADLPCCYFFETATVNDKENPAIVINGHCIKCKSKILLESREVENDSVTFDVSAGNPYGIQHYEKKHLTEYAHKKLMKLFGRVRKKRKKEQTGSDLEDKQEPDPKVAHKEYTYEELQNFPSAMLAESLKLLSRKVDHIKEVGVDKFYVVYWLQIQMNLYNDIQNHLKTPVYVISSEPLTFKIDDQKRDFILHVVLTNVNDVFVPAMQILTEKMDKNLLLTNLLEWRKLEMFRPSEIIVDSNNIMQDAVCSAFNSTDLVNYVDTCFAMLTNDQSSDADICFIRTNIVNIIDKVSQWDCLMRLNTEVKLFYKKCIGLLVNCYNLTSFATILENIMTVAYSKYTSDKCSTAQDSLDNIMRDCDFNEEFWTNDEHIVRLDVDIKNENTRMRPIYSFINELRQGVETNLKRTIPSFDLKIKKNDYYSVQFIVKLCELCLEFPVWTHVMQNYIQSFEDVSVSLNPRTYFDDLCYLMSKRKRRIDDFVIAHTQKINADVEAARTIFESIHQSDVPDSILEEQTGDVAVSIGHDHIY